MLTWSKERDNCAILRDLRIYYSTLVRENKNLNSDTPSRFFMIQINNSIVQLSASSTDRSKMHERIEHAYIIMSFDQFREPVDLIIQNCC